MPISHFIHSIYNWLSESDLATDESDFENEDEESEQNHQTSADYHLETGEKVQKQHEKSTNHCRNAAYDARHGRQPPHPPTDRRGQKND